MKIQRENILPAITVLIIIAVYLLIPIPAAAGFGIDLESGAASPGYNDVRIPKETGTAISLTSDLSGDVSPYFRGRLNYTFGERNSLSLLIAPLRLESRGPIDREIHFNNAVFSPGTSITAGYRFDSYRLTYRYTLKKSAELNFGLGLTAKIRDASISLSGGGQTSEKTNTGFVPLINFLLDWQFSRRAGLLLEGDALAAPQGRAEDILAAIKIKAGRKISVKLGYRVLEGGADVDEVYNFALVNYAVLGLTVQL